MHVLAAFPCRGEEIVALTRATEAEIRDHDICGTKLCSVNADIVFRVGRAPPISLDKKLF